MKKLLHDYGIPQDTMCVFYDNTSAINLSKNPVQHSKSKRIKIQYHFIWDLVEDKVVCLKFIHTDNQRRTSSPSLSMVHGLNHFVRPSVLVQFLESLVCCVLCLFVVSWLFLSWAHTFGLMFVFFYIKFFLLLAFVIYFMSKIQKHIKRRKSKMFDRHCWVLSQNMFYLVLLCKWLCASTSIACFLCTNIIVGEILKSMWLL